MPPTTGPHQRPRFQSGAGLAATTRALARAVRRRPQARPAQGRCAPRRMIRAGVLGAVPRCRSRPRPGRRGRRPLAPAAAGVEIARLVVATPVRAQPTPESALRGLIAAVRPLTRQQTALPVVRHAVDGRDADVAARAPARPACRTGGLDPGRQRRRRTRPAGGSSSTARTRQATLYRNGRLAQPLPGRRRHPVDPDARGPLLRRRARARRPPARCSGRGRSRRARSRTSCRSSTAARGRSRFTAAPARSPATPRDGALARLRPVRQRRHPPARRACCRTAPRSTSSELRTDRPPVRGYRCTRERPHAGRSSSSPPSPSSSAAAVAGITAATSSNPTGVAAAGAEGSSRRSAALARPRRPRRPRGRRPARGDAPVRGREARRGREAVRAARLARGEDRRVVQPLARRHGRRASRSSRGSTRRAPPCS